MNKLHLGSAALALSAAVAARAQDVPPPPPPQEQPQQQQPQQQQPAQPDTGTAPEAGKSASDAAKTASVQGTVQRVDINRAELTILQTPAPAGTGTGTSTGGPVTLRARPFDLADMKAGDVVVLQANDYDGVRWLAPREGPIDTKKWAKTGSITGPVTNVNKGRGIIEVRGEQFHAHPQQTEGIVSGQLVTLKFAQVGDQPWVSSLEQGGAKKDEPQKKDEMQKDEPPKKDETPPPVTPPSPSSPSPSDMP